MAHDKLAKNLCKPMNFMPKRIILIRHGESEINEDEEVLEFTPNYKIKLSQKGVEQAQNVGREIKKLLKTENDGNKEKVFFYVSPSERTRETLREIIFGGKTFGKDEVIGVQEECRLREQHFGNFQEVERRRKIKRARCRYGSFFYRVPDGESSADVFDRVSSFIEALRRDMNMGINNKFNMNDPCDNHLNLVIVSHGLTILLFLMKWFNWTVDQFENLKNPTNCENKVMQLGCSGEYSLALHHTDEELKSWGLSQAMIQDQKNRAFGPKMDLNPSHFPYFDSFFKLNPAKSDELVEEKGKYQMQRI